jgi:hypothetical protein
MSHLHGGYSAASPRGILPHDEAFEDLQRGKMTLVASSCLKRFGDSLQLLQVRRLRSRDVYLNDTSYAFTPTLNIWIFALWKAIFGIC